MSLHTYVISFKHMYIWIYVAVDYLVEVSTPPHTAKTCIFYLPSLLPTPPDPHPIFTPSPAIDTSMASTDDVALDALNGGEGIFGVL